MAEMILLLCRVVELSSASGSSLDSPGGRAWSVLLAVTVGHVRVGRKVSQPQINPEEDYPHCSHINLFFLFSFYFLPVQKLCSLFLSFRNYPRNFTIFTIVIYLTTL